MLTSLTLIHWPSPKLCYFLKINLFVIFWKLHLPRSTVTYNLHIQFFFPCKGHFLNRLLKYLLGAFWSSTSIAFSLRSLQTALLHSSCLKHLHLLFLLHSLPFPSVTQKSSMRSNFFSISASFIDHTVHPHVFRYNF